MRRFWLQRTRPLTIGAKGLKVLNHQQTTRHHLGLQSGALGGGFVAPFFIKTPKELRLPSIHLLVRKV